MSLSTTNPAFQVNDLILAQRVDLAANGTQSTVYSIQAQITSVDDYGLYQLHVLSGESYMAQYAADAEWVRVGNTSNSARQGSIYSTAVGTNPPFIQIYDGVTSFNNAVSGGFGNISTIKVHIGNLAGAGTTPEFGALTGYGIYTNKGYFSGSIAASTLDIGGDDATSFHVDIDGGIWAGASVANKATAPFRVSNAGALTATSATITGAITGATTLDIGGDDTTSFHIDSGGGIWSGAAIAGKATAPFRVSSAGALVATSATITGAISGSTIDIGGADATSFHVDVNGNIWSGAAAYADGVFKVSSAGLLTCSNVNLTGGAAVATILTGLGNIPITSGSENPVVHAGSDHGSEWSAFTIRYGSVTYSVSAGNTHNRYVWFTGASATLSNSDTIPVLGQTEFLMWYVNTAGVLCKTLLNSVIYADLVSCSTLSALNANMGTITAGSLDIGGADTTSYHVDTAGNIWSGAALFADAPFKVANTGALTATSATITGAISGATTLDIGGDDTTSFHVDTTGGIWSGASIANKATAPFSVSNGGKLDLRRDAANYACFDPAAEGLHVGGSFYVYHSDGIRTIGTVGRTGSNNPWLKFDDGTGQAYIYQGYSTHNLFIQNENYSIGVVSDITTQFKVVNTSSVSSCEISLATAYFSGDVNIASGKKYQVDGVDIATVYSPLASPVLTGTVTLPGMKMNVVTKTADYTATVSDFAIIYTALADNRVLTLPAATTKSMLYISRTTADPKSVTVTRAGSDTIQGATTKVLADQYDSLLLVADGTATWSIISNIGV
jgi:hypothetical protein